MKRTTVPFRLIDAFAETPFSGNPAGVVIPADGLEDVQCQMIAREVNASETVFIYHAGDPHARPRIRWFTPSVEVGFCGHATLAAACAWHETQRDAALRGGAVEFDSAAGVLRIRPEPIPARPGAFVWWLSMPDAGLRPDNTNPMKSCELLGLVMDDLEPASPFMRTRDEDVIVLIKSWQKLNSLQPNFAELARWSAKHRVRGWCVATRDTLSPSIQCASRFFAPAAGINEDPVTGSVHGPLALLMVVSDLAPLVSGKAALTCIQGQPGGRTGIVRALIERRQQQYAVQVGGTCHVTMRGEMNVPPLS